MKIPLDIMVISQRETIMMNKEDKFYHHNIKLSKEVFFMLLPNQMPETSFQLNYKENMNYIT